MNVLVFWGTIATVAAAVWNYTMWQQWRRWHNTYKWRQEESQRAWKRSQDARKDAHRWGMREAQIKFERQYKRALRSEEKGKDTWKVRMVAARQSIDHLLDPPDEEEP